MFVPSLGVHSKVNFFLRYGNTVCWEYHIYENASFFPFSLEVRSAGINLSISSNLSISFTGYMSGTHTSFSLQIFRMVYIVSNANICTYMFLLQSGDILKSDTGSPFFT